MQKRTGRTVIGALAVATAVVGSVAFAGAGTGAAATASLTLAYSCPFPLIGTQDMTVRIQVTDLADSAVVGQPVPPTKVTAVATVPATATSGLRLVGASTVEGTARSQATVDNAGTPVPVVASLTVAKTNIPLAGSFNTTATGGTPSLTFTKAGVTTVRLGAFSTTLTPRTSSGGLTGLGTFTSNCTLKPNQNTLLHTFTVAPA